LSKRGAHEGSIYQRQDGRWAASVHLGYANGRRLRKTFYGRTRRDVQERMTTALGQVQARLPVRSDDRETVAAYLYRWLDTSARQRVRPRTLAGYRLIVDKHLIPAIGREPVAKLTPAQVQVMLNAKSASGSKPQTTRNIHAVLRRALTQGLRWGVVSRNVATLVDLPRVDREEIRGLSPAGARAVMTALAGDRIEPLVLLTLSTGLRQGEALGLRWQDVDLEAGTVRVRHSLQRMPGRGIELGEPKTARSRRTLALPTSTANALRMHRKSQLQERLWAGSRWQEADFVFTTSIGTPMIGSDVTRRFQALLRGAGLPPMRFHDLRHGAASLLLAQGVHPRVVMEMLGHSTITLTMNVYSHVIPDLQREAATKMEAVFNL
jgi:integrase